MNEGRFNPKQNFLLFHKDTAEQLRGMTQQRWLVDGFNFSLAEVSYNGANHEEIRGILKFITTFQNLAEASPEAQRLPPKTLTSYEGAIPPEVLNPAAKQKI